jgi:hypothetical protein
MTQLMLDFFYIRLHLIGYADIPLVEICKCCFSRLSGDEGSNVALKEVVLGSVQLHQIMENLHRLFQLLQLRTPNLETVRKLLQVPLDSFIVWLLFRSLRYQLLFSRSHLPHQSLQCHLGISVCQLYKSGMSQDMRSQFVHVDVPDYKFECVLLTILTELLNLQKVIIERCIFVSQHFIQNRLRDVICKQKCRNA